MRQNRRLAKRFTWACEGRYILFYLLAALCFMFPIEYLHIGLNYSTILDLRLLIPQGKPIGETLSAFLPTLGDGLLLALPMLFFTRRRWLVFIPLVLFAQFCLIQTWYARVYEDIMPYSSFLLFDNVNEVLLKSVVGLIQWRDLCVFLPILFLFGYWFYLRRTTQYPTRHTRLMVAGLTLVIALASYAGRSYRIYHRALADQESPWAAFITPYNYREYVIYNGVVPYTVYACVSSFAQTDELSDRERQEIENYLADMPRYTDNSYAVEPGRNLILIVVEAMNSWMLNRTINGVEVMPRLNGMLREEGTFSALRLIPQVKDGRSSDGHLLFNTGLLPCRVGATAVLYGSHTYPSLGEALKAKGYTTLNVVCDRAQDWNQVETSPAYGFDRLYDKSSFGEGEMLSDSALFAHSLSLLKQLQGPFFAQLVTISTHAPCGKPESPTALSQLPSPVANTLEAFHRLDNQLGVFIDSLKATGLYDRSVVAIVSDHDEVGLDVWNGRESRALADREVAMILLNTGQTASHDSVAGQIDIYPTLLDAMGCNEYPWKGLGHSLLRTPVESAAHWSGEGAGNLQSPLYPQQIKAWEISHRIVVGDYFSAPKEKK